ncbi:MAG: trypsin-like serine protease [Elusimicrobia bacterium]|nr:trypsin-like serine protease [Elusimicrobiota bacterium]
MMRRSFASLLAAATLLGGGPARAELENAVYGGRAPGATGYRRSTVAIMLSPGDYQPMIPCTGVLIAPNLVLTAAHNFDGAHQPVSVEFFDDEGRSRAMRQVTGKRLHAEYKDDAYTNDIAVVSFAGSLPTGYAAADWSKNPAEPAVGDSITLAGAGLTQNKSYEGLRIGTMKVDGTFPSHRLFSGAPDETKASGCSGDSGGPAYKGTAEAPVIVGLVAAGQYKDCSNFGWVGFTAVAPYKEWIETAIAELGARPAPPR